MPRCVVPDGAFDWSTDRPPRTPLHDPAINALRAPQQRNMLSTLLLSQGEPMILAGDEFGRSQQGNNNAYCQDNRISWVDWRLSQEQQQLLAFSRALIQLRKEHTVLHRRSFFQGRSIHGLQISDIEWYRPDGEETKNGTTALCAAWGCC